MGNLDGTCVIVDEAHNLFRAITNGSKNGKGFYDLVMRSRNMKLFFLSGTPIASHPFEMVPCFNMLHSGTIPLLPTDFHEFNKLYVDGQKIKNRGKLQNRLSGLISYVAATSTPGATSAPTMSTGDLTDIVKLPEIKPIEVVRVNMDPEQYVSYQLARDKELEELEGKYSGPSAHKRVHVAPPPPLQKPVSSISSTYRVKSRMISNYYPAEFAGKKPEDIPLDRSRSPKFESILMNIRVHENQLGIVYSQFVGIGGLGEFARYLIFKGWKRFEPPITIGRLHKKFMKGEPLVDESFTGESFVDEPLADESFVDEPLADEPPTGGGGLFDGPGLPLMEDVIESGYTGPVSHGKTEVDWWSDDSIPVPIMPPEYNKTGGGEGSLTFAILSGEVDLEERKRIVSIFIDPDNIHGSKIGLLLISSTGAEGLDLKNVRHVHMMEPYWTWGRARQILYRAARSESHIMLESDEQNVQMYIYVAIPPIIEKLPDGKYAETTDTELYSKTIEDYVLIDDCQTLLQECSIECSANNGLNCRVCNPTSQYLFTTDPSRDVRASDNCNSIQESSVRADKITVNGTDYYYREDSDNPYGFQVFAWNKEFNGYIELRLNDPVIMDVIEKVKLEK
jgi:hypothetical protein